MCNPLTVVSFSISCLWCRSVARLLLKTKLIPLPRPRCTLQGWLEILFYARLPNDSSHRLIPHSTRPVTVAKQPNGDGILPCNATSSAVASKKGVDVPTTLLDSSSARNESALSKFPCWRFYARATLRKTCNYKSILKSSPLKFSF